MAKVLIENSAFDKLLFGQGSIRIDIYLRKNVPATDKSFILLLSPGEVLILTLSLQYQLPACPAILKSYHYQMVGVGSSSHFLFVFVDASGWFQKRGGNKFQKITQKN